VLGYVGSTGNASAAAPHLHFAIFRTTAEKQWWKGEPVNPYLILH
jgi:murein DD-endopeptidase MepM/ murein hydrolase activator NlpD